MSLEGLPDWWYVSWDGEPHSHVVVDPPDFGMAVAVCGKAVPAGLSLWTTLDGPPLDEACSAGDQ